MRRRQVPECRCGGDLKARRQLLEAPGGQLRAARGELQQPRHLLLREIADRRPEPAHDPPELRGVAVDDVVRLEVRDRVLAGAAQQQLEGQ